MTYSRRISGSAERALVNSAGTYARPEVRLEEMWQRRTLFARRSPRSPFLALEGRLSDGVSRFSGHV